MVTAIRCDGIPSLHGMFPNPGLTLSPVGSWVTQGPTCRTSGLKVEMGWESIREGLCEVLPGQQNFWGYNDRGLRLAVCWKPCW